MKGFSWAGLKKNPSLIPLFVFVGCGVTAAVFYTARMALKSPDASFTKRNPEPWNDYSNKQYKFYSPVLGKDDFKSKAPQY